MTDALRCTTRAVAALVLLTFFSPGIASAQAPSTVKDLLRDLFATIPTPAEINSGLAADVLANAARFPEETAKLVGLGVAALPAGSSSAGFTYRLDPIVGDYVLKSESFGALMGERPLTSGRGSLNVAFNYQRTRFDELNGIEMADQDQNSIDQGLFISDNGGIFPDGLVQYITDRAYFSATVTSLNVFLNYGVTDHLDVGIVAPIVSVSATGRRQRFWSLYRAFELDPQGVLASFPEGPEGVRDQIARTTVSATGLGDLSVRAKFSPIQSRSGGLGVLADIRLPTGDEEDLLGSGEPSARFLGLASIGNGSASFAATGGYTSGGLSDAISYSATVDVALGRAKNVTVAATLTGQRVLDGIVLDRLRTLDTLSASGIRTTFDRQIVGDEALNVLDLAIGAKIHLQGNWLLAASVLFPMNESGFRGALTPVVGLDYTWSGR